MKKTSALIAAALVSACSGSPAASESSAPPERGATPVLAVTGTIANENQLDAYPFAVPSGGARVHFRTFDSSGTACDPVNKAVDTTVEVLDATGTSVWYEDDSTSVPSAFPYCEDFSIPLEAGAYTAVVGGWQPVPFDYTLKIELL
jgi:hypothetical protein